MTEPTHKKKVFSIADLLFLKCPCTVTLALGLIGKWTLRDIIKCHSNVITIWQTSAIEVTALLKNLGSEIKGVPEKESIIGVRGR